MTLTNLIGRCRKYLGWLMAKFSKNPGRQAPYKNCRFSVQWDGKEIPGISRVSGLRRTTERVSDRGGGDAGGAVLSPGRTNYDPVVLERGRTHDAAFERWANKVHNFGGGQGAEASLKDYKKDVAVSLHNMAGQRVMTFRLYNCWPSEYVALGELDATASETATESLTLQHEGWERDYDVTEPGEPVVTEPPE